MSNDGAYFEWNTYIVKLDVSRMKIIITFWMLLKKFKTLVLVVLLDNLLLLLLVTLLLLTLFIFLDVDVWTSRDRDRDSDRDRKKDAR